MEATPYADPLVLQQWELTRWAINHLIVAVGFNVTGALSLLLAHALIPSLVLTHDAPRDIGVFRTPLYFIAVASIALGITSIVRAAFIAIPVVFEMFPRILV